MLPLTPANRKIEWHIILTIVNNNNFPPQLITNLKRKLQQKTKTNEPKNDNSSKWAAIFTFHSPRIRKITNLFKQTNIRIAYRGTNTLRQQTEQINQYNSDTKDSSQNYKKGGVYKTECKTCNKAYIGQTSRDITQRYREHIRYIRNNDHQSAYAEHILRNVHEYGNLTETILLKSINKISLHIPYEQLLIQTFYQNGNLIQE